MGSIGVVEWSGNRDFARGGCGQHGNIAYGDSDCSKQHCQAVTHADADDGNSGGNSHTYEHADQDALAHCK
jgi:hypothetical protein